MPPEPPRVEPVAPSVDPEARRAILERLARHEMSAEQAAAALRGEAVESLQATETAASPETTEQAETPAVEQSDVSAAQEQPEVTSNE